jgi:cyclopropane fatty-acyl-phospholipid synthase-like methyltransferase
MAGLQTTLQLRKMRRDWERRARENPRYYVLTGQSQWSDEEFYRSGEITVEEEILTDLPNICQGRDPKAMTVLEIGCGAGRVTRALANFFGSVWAVDISAEMIRHARQAVADFPNAHVHQSNGKDLSVVRHAPPFDFAFSSLVFQHIPSREIIENYVRDVHALLLPGALFKFQVQGGAPRPAGVGGDTWVGCSFTTEDARAMAFRCGFEMRYETGAGEQYYWLWFFKSPPR